MPSSRRQLLIPLSTSSNLPACLPLARRLETVESQPLRRLHPSEPTLVADGDVVDLGDGITLTFRGLV